MAQLHRRLQAGTLAQLLAPELSLVLEKEIPALHRALRSAFSSNASIFDAPDSAPRAVRTEPAKKNAFGKAFSRIGNTLLGAGGRGRPSLSVRRIR